MDERNDQEGHGEPPHEVPGRPSPAGGGPAAGSAEAPTSPMPLSMPPLGPDADPTLEQVWAVPTAHTQPGTVLPAAAGEAPPGDQPPYLPPYGDGWSSGGLPRDPVGPSARRRSLAALAAVAIATAGLGAGLGVAFAGTGPAAKGAGAAASSLPAPSGGALSSAGSKMSVAAIASAVEPSVVDIRTNVVSPVGRQSAAAGTGMIVTPSGEVLTNNHVVENATTIRVVVAHHGQYAARVIGVNPARDVALLQIEGASNLPYVTLGNSSSVAVGNSVVAVGNALGMGGTPSVVTGEISAVGRTIRATDPGLTSETLHNLLETTAQIEPGDSGGPLLNSSGKVVGMDTAAASADSGGSVGFAIPIDQARSIVVQMQHHRALGGTILGASPFLGVYESGTASPSGSLGGLGASGSRPAGGVTIAAVAGSSPAQRAGLEAGDVITSIDGTATTTWHALQQAVRAKQPGQRINLAYVVPGGGSHTVAIRLAGLPK